MPKILLTGGGTAGHVTPNIALIPALLERGFEIEYMGSKDGIEKELIEQIGIPYTGISTGKLRRYLSGKNITDIARINHGVTEAKHYMKEHKPDIVFSKGGFVSVPVVFAASIYNIPVVIHESDLSPGLANKLCYSRAAAICYNFPETRSYLENTKFAGKITQTGLPIRESLLNGSKEKGMKICGFTGDKPVMLVIGGSLGSLNVNNAVRGALDGLLEHFQIIHICGRDKTDESLRGRSGYAQFEYVNEELKDMMAAADIVISRAGANVIWELEALKKPALLIPLGTAGSRGDQILNAESFEKQGFSAVLSEDDLTPERLLSEVKSLYENREKYIYAMNEGGSIDASYIIAGIISNLVKNRP